LYSILNSSKFELYNAKPHCDYFCLNWSVQIFLLTVKNLNNQTDIWQIWW